VEVDRLGRHGVLPRRHSIVALASTLTVFQAEFGLSTTGVGILASTGPNAVGSAIGPFFGGRLSDELGRKRIYKRDQLVYALGIALAVHPAMLFVGTVSVGVAAGADVPTSLALVGELAPDKGRARLLGFTQVA
jgi:MFS transporter, SP family, inositol transporter